MSTKQTEALKLALEALVAAYQGKDKTGQVTDAITAIREALAEQPAQNEPVAVYVGETWCGSVVRLYEDLPLETPLYTSPPASKPWVGLTDDEMHDLEKQFNAERVRTSDEEYLVIYPGDYWAWQRAIEAKLREKNGGGV